MKQLLVFFMLLCSATVFAQDVIVKKDGSTILARVLEVNTDNIKYKKHSNQNGPTYTVNKSELMSINYQNGEKDIFEDMESDRVMDSQVSHSPSTPRLIQKKTAENNSQLIDSYKTVITQKKEADKKNATYCDVYFGVASNSILSNEDIEISFVSTNEMWLSGFDIIIKNKSQRILYIDKGNCFRVINETNPYCYYSATEQTTVGRNGGGGASLGMGSVAGVLGIGGVAGQLANGVSVGGGSSRSSSTTYTEQRVIAIPPHSSKKLCENKIIKISSNWSKTIDPNEDFGTYDYGNRTDGSWRGNSETYIYRDKDARQFGLYKGDLKVGQVVTYNEKNTPQRRVYTMTYSQEEDFRTYSTLNFTLFIQQAIGCEFWSNKWMDNVEFKYDKRICCNYAKLHKK